MLEGSVDAEALRREGKDGGGWGLWLWGVNSRRWQCGVV